MRPFRIAAACANLLTACSLDTSSETTAVARNFEELASAIARCAGELRGCKGDDAGADGQVSCRTEFLECRERAGANAETALAAAIGQCQEQAQSCRDAEAAAADGCGRNLRACLGDTRANGAAARDAGTPNPNAPTYQCFGQLRECVGGADDARTCAADVRNCVIAAVGDPAPGRRPTPPTPPRDPGGAGADARAGSSGGLAGSAAEAGAPAQAGAPARAGSPASAGTGAAGTPATPPSCETQHAACLMRGEKPTTCDREQRKCVRDEP